MRLWLNAGHLLASFKNKKAVGIWGRTWYQLRDGAQGLYCGFARGQKPGGGSCLHCDRSNASGVCRNRGDQGTVATLPTEELALASAVLFRCS